jgi:hypothetical protein
VPIEDFKKKKKEAAYRENAQPQLEQPISAKKEGIPCYAVTLAVLP